MEGSDSKDHDLSADERQKGQGDTGTGSGPVPDTDRLENPSSIETQQQDNGLVDQSDNGGMLCQISDDKKINQEIHSSHHILDDGSKQGACAADQTSRQDNAGNLTVSDTIGSEQAPGEQDKSSDSEPDPDTEIEKGESLATVKSRSSSSSSGSLETLERLKVAEARSDDQCRVRAADRDTTPESSFQLEVEIETGGNSQSLKRVPQEEEKDKSSTDLQITGREGSDSESGTDISEKAVSGNSTDDSNSTEEPHDTESLEKTEERLESASNSSRTSVGSSTASSRTNSEREGSVSTSSETTVGPDSGSLSEEEGKQDNQTRQGDNKETDRQCEQESEEERNHKQEGPEDTAAEQDSSTDTSSQDSTVEIVDKNRARENLEISGEENSKTTADCREHSSERNHFRTTEAVGVGGESAQEIQDHTVSRRESTKQEDSGCEEELRVNSSASSSVVGTDKEPSRETTPVAVEGGGYEQISLEFEEVTSIETEERSRKTDKISWRASTPQQREEREEQEQTHSREPSPRSSHNKDRPGIDCDTSSLSGSNRLSTSQQESSAVRKSLSSGSGQLQDRESEEINSQLSISSDRSATADRMSNNREQSQGESAADSQTSFMTRKDAQGGNRQEKSHKAERTQNKVQNEKKPSGNSDEQTGNDSQHGNSTMTSTMNQTGRTAEVNDSEGSDQCRGSESNHQEVMTSQQSMEPGDESGDGGATDTPRSVSKSHKSNNSVKKLVKRELKQQLSRYMNNDRRLLAFDPSGGKASKEILLQESPNTSRRRKSPKKRPLGVKLTTSTPVKKPEAARLAHYARETLDGIDLEQIWQFHQFRVGKTLDRKPQNGFVQNYSRHFGSILKSDHYTQYYKNIYDKE